MSGGSEASGLGQIDIIIPTYNNREYLEPCLASLLAHPATAMLGRVLVVNNGAPTSCDWIDDRRVAVVQSGGANLGWEGGLLAGLAHSDAPIVGFLNDDTILPPPGRAWLDRLLPHFADARVGAVGPASDVVSGYQCIDLPATAPLMVAHFLIGFCLLVRRAALERAGGVDPTLPGGDDLDLSLRLRHAGYLLLIDRDVFVQHIGFKTGTRVRGDWDQPLGWNSHGFAERVNEGLIVKHGWRDWWELQRAYFERPPAPYRKPSQDSP